MTRASRARMRAVGAQRRTLYGVVSSAYDSGRDGRLSRVTNLTPNQRPIRPLCPAHRPDNRTRHVRLHKQGHVGRERPRTRGVGRQSQVGTGVVHAPLSVPPPGRAPRGRHRTPSDRGGDPSRNFPHVSVLAAARAPYGGGNLGELERCVPSPGGQPRSSDLSPLPAAPTEATREGEQERSRVRAGICRRASRLSGGWLE